MCCVQPDGFVNQSWQKSFGGACSFHALATSKFCFRAEQHFRRLQAPLNVPLLTVKQRVTMVKLGRAKKGPAKTLSADRYSQSKNLAVLRVIYSVLISALARKTCLRSLKPGSSAIRKHACGNSMTLRSLSQVSRSIIPHLSGALRDVKQRRAQTSVGSTLLARKPTVPGGVASFCVAGVDEMHLQGVGVVEAKRLRGGRKHWGHQSWEVT